MEVSNSKSNLVKINRQSVAPILVILAALAFVIQGCSTVTQADPKANELAAPITVPQGDEVATFSGGCFWAMDAMFRLLKGVDKTQVGFSGGQTAHPTYEQVCSETTGHAETLQIVFNPKVITYNQLLDIFFHVHDPSIKNQQGDDIGESYRSMIFYHDESQKQAALAEIASIEKSKLWPAVSTQVVPFKAFYPAENYHQDYYEHNPDQGYSMIVIAPKIAKFRAHYGQLLK